MLEKIICDKFVGVDIVNGTVSFQRGLNIVMGGEDADNSIGKSTMMLIIDYCFGGTSYPNEDIVAKVGEHEIRWIMNFGSEESPDRHYFGRFPKNGKDPVIYYEDGFSAIKENKPFLEYKKDLHQALKLDAEIPLSMMTSLFFRVYGKGNIHLREPIKSYAAQPKRDSISDLEKLFLKYHLFGQAKDARTDMRERIDLQTKQLQKDKTFCAQSSADFNRNLAQIKALRKQLARLISEEDARINEERVAKNEEGAKYKRLLSKLNRRKAKLLEEIEIVKGNMSEIIEPDSADLDELASFFQLMNLQEVHRVQEFHAATVAILKKLCTTKIAEYEKEIRELDRNIKDIEGKLKALGISLNHSQRYLDEKARLEREIWGLEQQNAGYSDRLAWDKAVEVSDAEIKKSEPTVLKEIETEINDLLVSYSKSISGPTRMPPRLILGEDGEHYGFVSPFDKGTGTDYRNLVMFDLSIISLTQMPCLIHDSLLFKNIDVSVQQAILKAYLAIENKQIFIAYDNLRNLNDQSLKDIMQRKTVLHLGKGNNALFGEDWSEEVSEEERLAKSDFESNDANN